MHVTGDVSLVGLGHTWSVALPFCTRMLWPWPRMVPSLATRQAPMGTPPSAAPFLASKRAARKPGSVSDMVRLNGKVWLAAADTGKISSASAVLLSPLAPIPYGTGAHFQSTPAQSAPSYSSAS